MTQTPLIVDLCFTHYIPFMTIGVENYCILITCGRFRSQLSNDQLQPRENRLRENQASWATEPLTASLRVKHRQRHLVFRQSSELHMLSLAITITAFNSRKQTANPIVQVFSIQYIYLFNIYPSPTKEPSFIFDCQIFQSFFVTQFNITHEFTIS